MSKLLPMLAKSLTDKVKIVPHVFSAEIKYDGIRLVVEVSRLSDEVKGGVKSWSRTGNDCNHRLSDELLSSLSRLPSGTYDGELVLPGEGTYSSDVTTLSNINKLRYVIFDVLHVMGKSVVHLPQDNRRGMLKMIFDKHGDLPGVELAPSWNIESREHLDTIVEEIWSRGGEGVIVKRLSAVYSTGGSVNKRTDAFMKMKQKDDAVLTVLGFAASEGEINDRGAYGMTVLRDDAGVVTVVKTLNDAELVRLAREGASTTPLMMSVKVGTRTVHYNTNHPRVGTKLRIEFQFKTPDGSYRHPRWHRWGAE